MNYSFELNYILKDLNLNIFPPTNKEKWKQLAERQLKGANPDEELSWENSAGLKLESYYDEGDLSELKYLTDHFEGMKPHRWKLYEEIIIEDLEVANKKIIQALMGGCDGVILDINKNNLDIDSALIEVDRGICDIALRSSEKIKINGARGFIISPEGNCLQCTETHDPIAQILYILNNLSDESNIYRIAFSDFFMEIATLRALKFLLKKSGHIHIHTHIPKHASDEHQWFLNTTAGLASILGGSHSIDFSTAIGDPRISRNTGNLIREESGIEEYSDQCGGSYYIEVLTDRIVKKVEEKLK